MGFQDVRCMGTTLFFEISKLYLETEFSLIIKAYNVKCSILVIDHVFRVFHQPR